MITPEQHQCHQVEHRLRDQGAEQDREGFPHPPGAPGERQRPRGLPEAGWQGRRHQDPDHRRRGHVAAADRPVGQRRAGDPVPGGGAEEERDRHQRTGENHQGEVGADDAFDDVVDADFLRREHGQPDPEDAGDGEAGPAGDAASAVAFARGGRVERGQAPRRSLRLPVGGAQSGPVGEALVGADRLRRLDRLLVDGGDLVGDPGPGVALGAAPGRLAHLAQARGFVVDALELLGEALRIAGRDEDAVDAVLDDVAVAGDLGGDHRRTGREGLGQDHAEALARERRRAEHVGLVQLLPQALTGDAPMEVDEAQQVGVGDVSGGRPRARPRSR